MVCGKLHTSRTCGRLPTPCSAPADALQMHKHSLILFHRQLCAFNPPAPPEPPLAVPSALLKPKKKKIKIEKQKREQPSKADSALTSCHTSCHTHIVCRVKLHYSQPPPAHPHWMKIHGNMTARKNRMEGWQAQPSNIWVTLVLPTICHPPCWGIKYSKYCNRRMRAKTGWGARW